MSADLVRRGTIPLLAQGIVACVATGLSRGQVAVLVHHAQRGHILVSGLLSAQPVALGCTHLVCPRQRVSHVVQESSLWNARHNVWSAQEVPFPLV